MSTHDDATLIAQAHRLVHAIGLLVDRTTDGELNQAEALVLWHLRDGPASMSQVHRAFGHRRSTLTSVIDRLERRKLAKRAPDPNDRRSFVVSLTPFGAKHAARIARTFAVLEREGLRGAGASEARDVLRRLIAAAEKGDKSTD